MDMKHTDLTIIGDGVTTLVYASAVNVIMARSVDIVSLNIFISIGIIIFIFIDWLSRIVVPRLLSLHNPKDQIKWKKPYYVLLKALPEIVGMYFLVAASIHILNTLSVGHINSRTAFAIYLFMTFIWNLMILFMMKMISWKQLMLGAINGSVFDLEGADVYTGHFKDTIIAAEKEIQKSGTTKDMMKNFNKFRKRLILKGGGRTIGQLLACHIAFANIIVSIALGFGSKLFFQSQLYEEWFGNIWLVRIAILFLILLVPTMLFYLYDNNLKKNDNEETSISKILRVMAGTLVIVLLILFYTTFDADANDVIFVMLIQQAIFSFIILFSVQKNNNESTITGQMVTSGKV